jgi:hypothetical protein
MLKPLSVKCYQSVDVIGSVRRHGLFHHIVEHLPANVAWTSLLAARYSVTGGRR